jgi:DNA-binding CsgD family transcriptional regulator
VTRLAESGAELAALAEAFYRRAFAGAVLFVGLAALGALALIPLRDSASPVGLATPTVPLAGLLVVAAPLAVWRAADLYRGLLRTPALELAPVVIAGLLLAYPLRSELWWPSCALLMLVAIVAPLRRTWAYCLAVLLANVGAHALAGDLGETPAVSIVGLWIGFGFWATLAGVFTDRIATYLIRVDVIPPPAGVEPTAPPDDPAPASALSASPAPLEVLTGRQLEVVALLADGLRYDEIAACLSISTRQVQRHVAHAVERAGVRNANELTAVAVASGIVPPR